MPATSLVHYSNDSFSFFLFFSFPLSLSLLFLSCPYNYIRTCICMFTFASVCVWTGQEKSMTDYHLYLERDWRGNYEPWTNWKNSSYWNINQRTLSSAFLSISLHIYKSLSFRYVYFIIDYLHTIRLLKDTHSSLWHTQN